MSYRDSPILRLYQAVLTLTQQGGIKWMFIYRWSGDYVTTEEFAGYRIKTQAWQNKVWLMGPKSQVAIILSDKEMNALLLAIMDSMGIPNEDFMVMDVTQKVLEALPSMPFIDKTTIN